MPKSMKELQRELDKEERAGFTKTFKKIGKIRRGEPTEEDKAAAIGKEKRMLRAMEKQAEKTGTRKGLAEAFRKKRARIMKAEGFPGTTTEQIKAGKIYGGAPKAVESIAKKLGSKKTPKIRLKKR